MSHDQCEDTEIKARAQGYAAATKDAIAWIRAKELTFKEPAFRWLLWSLIVGLKQGEHKGAAKGGPDGT